MTDKSKYSNITVDNKTYDIITKITNEIDSGNENKP
jgi:hypothetical protein